MAEYRFQRVLLKLSGEALMGDAGYGIDPKILDSLADQIVVVHDAGVEVAIVVGGGNIFRGIAALGQGHGPRAGRLHRHARHGHERARAPGRLEKHGVFTRVMSAIEMQAVAEPYIRRRAIRHLEKGRVVIFAAGTGQPVLHHRHDRRAARARDRRRMHHEGDQGRRRLRRRPDEATPTPSKFDELPYIEVLNRGLKVMDNTAISLCMDNDLPIIVFNMEREGNIERALQGRAGRDDRQRRETSVPNEIIADADERMKKARRRTSATSSRPCGPAARRRGPRGRQGRVLRHAMPSAQVATVKSPEPQHARRSSRGTSRCSRRDREGHPGLRPRPQPEQRRHGHPPAVPAARPRSAARSS